MDVMNLLKSQAEQVEVLRIQDETTSVVFEANHLKSCEVAETSGTAIRVIRKGKLGFAASTDAAALEKLVSNALESASFGEEIPLQFPIHQPSMSVKSFDPVLSELPIVKMVQIGTEILDLILPAEPDAKCIINLTRNVQSYSIRNHTGLDVTYKRSPLTIDVEVDRIVGDDILLVYDSFGTTVWEDNYLEFARILVEKLNLAHKITTSKGGKLPVLFSPAGTLALSLPLSAGLNGKNVYKGTSPLIGKIGEKIFDQKISLIDDGTLDGRPASAPYDDEGVPHRRNVIVEQGQLKGFLYDLKTAAQFGVESTGNATRTLFNIPQPMPTNFIIMPGDTPLQDIIKSIDEGILVENLLGLGQGNVISGAFSNPLSLAFKIEKGEIIGRIKDISIAGNVYDLLKNVAAISHEAQWVFNTFYAPYILLEEMNVVAKQ